MQQLSKKKTHAMVDKVCSAFLSKMSKKVQTLEAAWKTWKPRALRQLQMFRSIAEKSSVYEENISLRIQHYRLFIPIFNVLRNTPSKIWVPRGVDFIMSSHLLHPVKYEHFCKDVYKKNTSSSFASNDNVDDHYTMPSLPPLVSSLDHYENTAQHCTLSAFHKFYSVEYSNSIKFADLKHRIIDATASSDNDNDYAFFKSLDLAYAARANLNFIKIIASSRTFLPDLLHFTRFWRFLQSVKELKKGITAVPTYDIDFMWHLTMMFPSHYRRICQKATSFSLQKNNNQDEKTASTLPHFIINHRIDIDKAVLDTNFLKTKKFYEDKYNEPYVLPDLNFSRNYEASSCSSSFVKHSEKSPVLDRFASNSTNNNNIGSSSSSCGSTIYSGTWSHHGEHNKQHDENSLCSTSDNDSSNSSFGSDCSSCGGGGGCGGD